MKLKDPTINLIGLQPQTLFAMQVMNEVYNEVVPGKELVITSVNDAAHSLTSLHYNGCAFDCRTVAAAIWEEDAQRIKNRFVEKMGMSPDFDCVVEDDHIHVEYQPKRR